MRVGVLQHDIVWEDPEANFARLDPWLAAAAAAGVRVLVLTEMFSTGFSMATERTAEPEDGPSATFLSKRAAEHGLWICGTVPERPAGVAKPFNTLVLAGPDGHQHRYRKIHPFGYSDEDEHFSAGTDLVTVTVEGVRMTLFVCYDLRFADEFWATALDTDCYLVPANWPAARRAHWTALLRARAIENQAYVVGCNRVGRHGDLDYAGDSMVVDPSGEVLVSAARTETLLVAEIDPEIVASTRDRYPFLRDRR